MLSIARLQEFDLKYIPGLGPARGDVLKKELQINNAFDLLYHFPYRHVDRSRIYSIRELQSSMPYVQVRGEILSVETIGEGRGKRLVAHFSDGDGVIDLVWFQGVKYMLKQLKLHKPMLIFGKPSVFGFRINVVHPEISEEGDYVYQSPGVMPMYHTTEKMKRAGLDSTRIRESIRTIFTRMGHDLEETLPAWIIEQEHLMSLGDALFQIHFPDNADLLRHAKYRLKFEELFYIQLNIARYMSERQRKYYGYKFPGVGQPLLQFYDECLPFELTGAQKRVVKEIYADMKTGHQMNRLLQGDVGSGKTLVALLAMLIAVGNGYQACMMAPTEILASQHLESLREMLGTMDVRVELLTGSIRGKKRKALLEDLKKGEIDILVGTHAVIEDWVEFPALGLAVIDEQHRFGVAQRAKLWVKSDMPPHILVMTATPIPRTLAMTIYGDLQVSVIDELPPGRKPITTLHHYDDRRVSLYQSMHKQLSLGRQIYIVYPLIKESEKIDLHDLEQGYERIIAEFPKMTVCKVHGKMKAAEKAAEMQRFVSGEAQIMVATTVIEVGVNVPNASVMVIENANRFGLSQLHQLRGRVGRGADQSYCILVTGYALSEITRRRIDIMVKSTDGFAIAEADLKLRGPGDMEGTQQSGMAFNLKIADIARDGQIVELVRNIAIQVVKDDPQFEVEKNEILWKRLTELRNITKNWGAIS